MDNPQAEVEMDLVKEDRNDWSLSSEEWLGHKKLFWPLFWEYHDSSEENQGSLEENGEGFGYEGEDSFWSGVGADWNRRWKGWDSMDNYGKRGKSFASKMKKVLLKCLKMLIFNCFVVFVFFATISLSEISMLRFLGKPEFVRQADFLPQFKSAMWAPASSQALTV